ncbi:unnamed protein product [Cylicocyclus nassatus]|uniref:Peptidase S1 domain-containing protein n=1 Tax=Cylicocyclus nassatus TaxID=53992 RepID=A0AA36GWR1_CYLNA|nr:unnamed protein product [Cylicocyclus nassatus]
MRRFVCFLLVLQITMGQIQNVYDMQRCGISQINDAAQNSLGKRVRRSSADAQSNNQPINGDASNKDLDENAISDQDDNDFMQEKVMGGKRAARGELPWAVYILTSEELCGGTLISRRHVVTAAHCFSASKWKMGRCNTSDMYPMEAVINSTKVFVGGSCLFPNIAGCNTSDIGKMYKVARASYEQYFAFNCKGTHDIALLELTEDVPKTINHVCLPFLHQLEEIEDPYLKLRSFGWGLDPLKYTNIPSPYLQIAELGVKSSKEECNRMKNWKSNDTFCTKSGPQYICRGDSGGGVTATIRKRTYLIGIISFGPNCIRVAKGKNISHPQVSTDIMYYKEVIKNNSYIKRMGHTPSNVYVLHIQRSCVQLRQSL